MISLVCSHAALLSDAKRLHLLQPQTNPLSVWLWSLKLPLFFQAESMGAVWGPIPPPAPRTPITSMGCLTLRSLAEGLSVAWPPTLLCGFTCFAYLVPN